MTKIQKTAYTTDNMAIEQNVVGNISSCAICRINLFTEFDLIFFYPLSVFVFGMPRILFYALEIVETLDRIA